MHIIQKGLTKFRLEILIISKSITIFQKTQNSQQMENEVFPDICNHNLKFDTFSEHSF